MSDTTSREKVLKKVRKALIHKTTQEPGDVDLESEIYSVPDEPLEILFAQKLTRLNGNFVFCETEKEFTNNLAALIRENGWDNVFALEGKIKRLLSDAGIAFSDKPEDFKDLNVGITLCESLVARTGSVMISSRQASGRKLPVYPNYHIVLGYISQLVMTHKEALKLISEKYAGQIPSLISSITGPSRTADIEKTLVQGAHGPKEIYVFLVDDTHLSE
ncbi:MAG: LUD domain-containing protein [Bacteroidota bacterium]